MAEIRPNPGPQEMFLSTRADVALFGGAAGGGKSFGLLLQPLAHIDNPQFGAVIFRRTYPQIFNEGALWDCSQNIYPLFDARPREAYAEWVFPSGAKVKFAHMEYEKNKKEWDGSQIAFIGFDEVTSFSETMFWYMLSRNRSTCGVRPYIRASCNPDSESWVAELIAWWINQETGYPIAERSGVIRWFVREDGRLMWFDSRKDAAKHLVKHGMKPELAVNVPKSFTFIPAKLEDNPQLESSDPGYRANLMAMEFVERERLLGGNWKIRPSAGMKFPRTMWVTKIKEQPILAPPPGLRLLRFWDKAYTEGGKGARTAGVLLGELPKVDAIRLGVPGYWIVDVRAGRWGDAEREAEIRRTAELDRQQYGHITTGLEEEGGAGKHSAHMTVWNLAGFDVYSEKPRSKKHIRWDGIAAQQQIGNVAIVQGDWDWSGMIRELDALAGSEQLDKSKLRDVADALSGAFKGLTDRGSQLTGDLLTSGDPSEDDRSPITDEELASEDMPDFLRELLVESREDRNERRFNNE